MCPAWVASQYAITAQPVSLSVGLPVWLPLPIPLAPIPSVSAVRAARSVSAVLPVLWSMVHNVGHSVGIMCLLGPRLATMAIWSIKMDARRRVRCRLISCVSLRIRLRGALASLLGKFLSTLYPSIKWMGRISWKLSLKCSPWIFKHGTK